MAIERYEATVVDAMGCVEGADNFLTVGQAERWAREHCRDGLSWFVHNMATGDLLRASEPLSEPRMECAC